MQSNLCNLSQCIKKGTLEPMIDDIRIKTQRPLLRKCRDDGSIHLLVKKSFTIACKQTKGLSWTPTCRSTSFFLLNLIDDR